MSPTPTPFRDDLTGEKAPKSRSRRGCLTCRRRRLKCDEVGPICGNCESFSRACSWGLKASFHASRMRCLSERESASFSALQSESRRATSWKFVDNTDEIRSCYQDDLQSPHGFNDANDGSGAVDNFEMRCDEDPDQDSDQTPDHYTTPENEVDYQDLAAQTSGRLDAPVNVVAMFTTGLPAEDYSQQESGSHLRSLSFTGSSTRSLDGPNAVFSPQINATPSSTSRDKMLSWPVDEWKKTLLIRSYLRETATWCETTDSMRHFSMQTTKELLDSQAYSAAAVAVASRQGDNTTGNARVETLVLYDFARETICSLEAWQNDSMVLAGALQLCVYCMMSMEVNEWRLHLRGCAGTFQEKGWTGASSGLPAACFWAFARIDIWAAYLTRQTTLIPTDFWITADYEKQNTAPLQDRYSNKAIWIFARIINELPRLQQKKWDAPRSTGELCADVISNLWEELDTWKENCPAAVQSLAEVPPPKGAAFPMILFGNNSAICGNIFYHTGCLLLLENGFEKPRASDDSKYESLWHAHRIAGISTTTDNHANWVNNLQPLFIAARFFHDPAEKIAVLKHLKDIERFTGWKTGSRAAELRELWGFG